MGDEEQPPSWEWGESQTLPIQFVVKYTNGWERTYPGDNWRVERMGEADLLIIGNGIPCTYIPLANVLSFRLENENKEND